MTKNISKRIKKALVVATEESKTSIMLEINNRKQEIYTTELLKLVDSGTLDEMKISGLDVNVVDEGIKEQIQSKIDKNVYIKNRESKIATLEYMKRRVLGKEPNDLLYIIIDEENKINIESFLNDLPDKVKVEFSKLEL